MKIKEGDFLKKKKSSRTQRSDRLWKEEDIYLFIHLFVLHKFFFLFVGKIDTVDLKLWKLGKIFLKKKKIIDDSKTRRLWNNVCVEDNDNVETGW